jgi:hypothetical protein
MERQTDESTWIEVSRGLPLFVYALAFGVALMSWWAFVDVLWLGGRAFGGDAEAEVVAWIVFALFGVGLPWFLWTIRLETRVDADTVAVRLAPFPTRRIPRAEIESAEACTYSPIGEYGGWGIRWSPWAGMAYNIHGNRGVRLRLTRGRKVLIGSDRPEELAAAIGAGGE